MLLRLDSVFFRRALTEVEELADLAPEFGQVLKLGGRELSAAHPFISYHDIIKNQGGL
jgi:hypothetical protein